MVRPTRTTRVVSICISVSRPFSSFSGSPPPSHFVVINGRFSFFRAKKNRGFRPMLRIALFAKKVFQTRCWPESAAKYPKYPFPFPAKTLQSGKKKRVQKRGKTSALESRTENALHEVGRRRIFCPATVQCRKETRTDFVQRPEAKKTGLKML